MEPDEQVNQISVLAFLWFIVHGETHDPWLDCTDSCMLSSASFWSLGSGQQKPDFWFRWFGVCEQNIWFQWTTKIINEQAAHPNHVSQKNEEKGKERKKKILDQRI